MVQNPPKKWDFGKSSAFEQARLSEPGWRKEPWALCSEHSLIKHAADSWLMFLCLLLSTRTTYLSQHTGVEYGLLGVYSRLKAR